MSIEQDVIETLKILSPEKQQEVLRFVQSLKPSEPRLQKHLRLSFAEKILPDLQRIHRDRDEPPSPVYADSLIRTIREMRDRSPHDPFTHILMALHDAMAFENHWVTYNGDQYLGAYTVLKDLVEREDLQTLDVRNAIVAFERLGFDMMPFTISTGIGLDKDTEN